MSDKLDPVSLIFALDALSNGGGGGGGSDNYNDLNNKPKINNVTLYGNKSLSDFGIDASISYDNSETYAAGSVGAELGNLKSEIDDFGDTYAKQDGSYDTLTVGQAKQLVATVGVEDKVPYLFLTTGGSADVGDRKTMEIVGGTVAWNQKINNGNFASTDYWQTNYGTFSVSDGIATVVPASDSTFSRLVYATSTIKGHKYLWGASFNGPSTIGYIRLSWNGALPKDVPFSGNWQRVEYIVDNVYDSSSIWQLYFGTGYDVHSTESYQIKDAVCFDLTQMFGSTIADYIYTLETANAGAGVAWFRKLFPKPYYAYNAGTLMSVKTSANVTTGFNQWDEETERGYINPLTGQEAVDANKIRMKNYMPVLPNTTYYKKTPNDFWNTYFDADKNYIGYGNPSQGTFTTPANCYYIRSGFEMSYGTTYKHDVCFNLHWDGERDGEYEPYVSHTYALDPDLELRGIPKLDADNALYYDGDTYTSDGTVTRKYGLITFDGNVTTGNPTAQADGFYTFIINVGETGVGVDDTIICNLVEGVAYNSRNYSKEEAFIAGNSLFFNTKKATTAAELKQVFGATNCQVVYELATPTTETADPYQTPQIVDDFGTEEFVDTRDVPIPVGHDTMYQANLRAKLEMAPDSPSGNGDYIVRHSNGQNAYVPITFPADELPAAPTEDGSYVLKATVADGAATYTWEAQS